MIRRPLRSVVRPVRVSPVAGLLLALVAGLLLAFPAGAQTRYLAFGDSITAGVGDPPEVDPPGYPPRLEQLLASAGRNAVVFNRGVGGERTPEGLARIGSVIAEGGDVLLLMEGSNDISRSISLETTQFNLGEMARRAQSQGLAVIQATVIPRIPRALRDADNILNQELNEAIRHQAGVQGRDLADHFEVFGQLPDLFAQYYWDSPEDFVGHPNREGYDVMAETFFDTIVGNDSVPPVTGTLLPVNGARNVGSGQPVRVELWDFGAGIDIGASRLFINGEEVGVAPTGNTRQVRLEYFPPSPWQGVVRVAYSARDLANPPNSVDRREIARFIIAGTVFLAGDLDTDGRVDGADLVAFARRFGARRSDGLYLAAADLNRDDIIDGEDLAILASNFGRSSF